MREMPTAKCMRFLKREMKSEAKMIVQLKDVVEGCNMPVKTYSILAPYL
jgi:ABC-type polysaccharide/polyol phosphate transport system ATPase subunit